MQDWLPSVGRNGARSVPVFVLDPIDFHDPFTLHRIVRDLGVVQNGEQRLGDLVGSPGDTVDLGDPIFEWTPVQVPVGFDVRYVVQLAELLPGAMGPGDVLP